MPFLRTETLKKLLPKLINPYDKEAIKHGAYELSLGDEIFITGNTTKQILTTGQQISIPSGQFALLITKEKVKIPNNCLGLISIKYGIKFEGLINVSGFHVDPGYEGKLKYTVYNAGSGDIPLTCGAKVFLIWYSKLDDRTADVYKGSRNGQDYITDHEVACLQGDIASPAQLKKEINDLKMEDNNIKNQITIIWAIIIAMVLLVITPIFNNFIEKFINKDKTNNTVEISK